LPTRTDEAGPLRSRIDPEDEAEERSGGDFVHAGMMMWLSSAVIAVLPSVVAGCEVALPYSQ
jgi:hypothetical protein